MKRSFVRIMSGLLVIAMLMALPVVSMAENITVDGMSVKLRCNHALEAEGSTMKATSNKKDPTCTEPGYQEYKCDYYDQCGYTIKTYTPMLGHDYSKRETYVASGEGSNDYYLACSHSGCTAKYLVTAVDGIHLHKHDGSDSAANAALVDSVTTAGCGGQVHGYTKVTCSRAGCTYVQYKDFHAPYAHTYGDWKWQNRPTENSYGIAYRECVHCNAVEKAQTYALTVEEKEGRVKTDGIFAYDAYYGGNKLL